jgi:hypothetical protein
MTELHFGFAFVSGLAFLIYGPLCLFTDHMKQEFERYQLSDFRKLVGALETLGGRGVWVGIWWEPLLIFSAAGLSLLMLLGLIVRLRLRDPISQLLPAALLMIINLAMILLMVGI